MSEGSDNEKKAFEPPKAYTREVEGVEYIITPAVRAIAMESGTLVGLQQAHLNVATGEQVWLPLQNVIATMEKVEPPKPKLIVPPGLRPTRKKHL